jgi:hypothetical protein
LTLSNQTDKVSNMIDYGIFQVQKKDDGKFVVSEQLAGQDQEFDTIDQVVEHIKAELQEVEQDTGIDLP